MKITIQNVVNDSTRQIDREELNEKAIAANCGNLTGCFVLDGEGDDIFQVVDAEISFATGDDDQWFSENHNLHVDIESDGRVLVYQHEKSSVSGDVWNGNTYSISRGSAAYSKVAAEEWFEENKKTIAQIVASLEQSWDGSNWKGSHGNVSLFVEGYNAKLEGSYEGPLPLDEFPVLEVCDIDEWMAGYEEGDAEHGDQELAKADASSQGYVLVI